MKSFSFSPIEMVSGIWRNRELIAILVRRETMERYRGSMLGLFWSFAQPALMLTIYTVFFSVLMQSRWGMAGESRGDFALILFAGLIAFNFFSECVNRAPNLILDNKNYVKKVVFPLEILPTVPIGAALFQATVSTLAWLIAFLYLRGVPYLTTLWLPIMFIPLVIFVLGACWILSVVGAYFRDISPIMGIVTTLFLFFSPIFYSAAVMPEQYRFMLYFNPLAPIIENIRNVLCWGNSPDWRSFFISMVISLLIAWVGFAIFQRTRKEFADGI